MSANEVLRICCENVQLSIEIQFHVKKEVLLSSIVRLPLRSERLRWRGCWHPPCMLQALNEIERSVLSAEACFLNVLLARTSLLDFARSQDRAKNALRFDQLRGRAAQPQVESPRRGTRAVHWTAAKRAASGTCKESAWKINHRF